MTSARALRVTTSGGPDVLAVQTVDVPAPGPGEARVRVAAAGVNFIDVYQRQGIYPLPTPFTVGMEGAGIVESLGPDCPPDSPGVGSRVAWAMTGGADAELALVPAASLVAVPDGVALDEAAAAMLQGMTAHFLTTSVYAVSPDSTVLVHAAAGGVGQWLVQFAASAGATVVGTAGTADKRAKAAALGAAHVLDYAAYDTAETLAEAVREANGGLGVHVAYDGVGRATFDASLASLRPRGLLALFGGSSGQVPPFDLQRLNAGGSLFVTRPTLAHYLADRAELLWRAGAVFEALRSGRVRLEIGGRYPLTDAAAAYAALEGRASSGKLVLMVGDLG